jgi:hypothetical protein
MNKFCGKTLVKRINLLLKLLIEIFFRYPSLINNQDVFVKPDMQFKSIIYVLTQSFNVFDFKLSKGFILLNNSGAIIALWAPL